MIEQEKGPSIIPEPKKKPGKHNYTSELELKSLLIRIKNDRFDRGVCEFNSRTNKYIKLFNLINDKKYEKPAKRNAVKARIKERIIRDSERTRIDHYSYERFGEIVLLMIKNILRKPQFSGYTYRDDFYSDAVYKITLYLHNFDHTKISEVSGLPVNAFAYISQYIHNSVIHIIKKKKKESQRMKNRIQMESLNHSLQLKNYELITENHYREEMIPSYSEKDDTLEIELLEVDSLVREVEEIRETFSEGLKDSRIIITYPHDYRITFDEYEQLKPLLSNLSIQRKRSNKELEEME